MIQNTGNTNVKILKILQRVGASLRHFANIGNSLKIRAKILVPYYF